MGFLKRSHRIATGGMAQSNGARTGQPPMWWLGRRCRGRNEMAGLRHRANGKRQAARFLAAGRRRRRLAPISRKGPLIPEAVLKKLQALNLPANEWVYNVCLR